MRPAHAQLKRQELFHRKLCTYSVGEGGGLGVHGSKQSPERRARRVAGSGRKRAKPMAKPVRPAGSAQALV